MTQLAMTITNDVLSLRTTRHTLREMIADTDFPPALTIFYSQQMRPYKIA